MNYKVLHATHQSQAKTFGTDELRRNFLLEHIFVKDSFTATYTLYDRLIVGGIMPVNKAVKLTPFTMLKADFFLQRREMGIFNVGGTGKISVDGEIYVLENKEVLYIGKGAKEVSFLTMEDEQPLFYYNSAPAHQQYPTRKISLDQAETVEMGSLETANHRIIRKLLVHSVVETCQLQMGLTELQAGSVWNTMPPHTHDRRMEAYFYFNLPENQVVSHFMGEPQETRHLWVKNHQAVISPPWSIHAGAGTSNYNFIWGMAGENLDYGDMDMVAPSEIR